MIEQGDIVELNRRFDEQSNKLFRLIDCVKELQRLNEDEKRRVKELESKLEELLDKQVALLADAYKKGREYGEDNDDRYGEHD